jgi:hypothetical protein
VEKRHNGRIKWQTEKNARAHLHIHRRVRLWQDFSDLISKDGKNWNLTKANFGNRLLIREASNKPAKGGPLLLRSRRRPFFELNDHFFAEFKEFSFMPFHNMRGPFQSFDSYWKFIVLAQTSASKRWLIPFGKHIF